MRFRPIFAEWISIPPDPSPDSFETTMFEILDIMIEIHEQTYGEKPTKILLGRFEQKRFSHWVHYAGMERIHEQKVCPEEFPLTHFLREVDKAYTEPDARRVNTEIKSSYEPLYEMKGLKVVNVNDEFHFEPI
jgi:hypothetical protein